MGRGFFHLSLLLCDLGDSSSGSDSLLAVFYATGSALFSRHWLSLGGRRVDNGG